jgi:uncharacterized protein YecT (DUF1311 family)
MKFSLSFLFAISLFSTSISQADPMAVDMVQQGLEECLKTDDGQSTMGMQMCHGNATELAERMMDTYYALTIRQLDLDSVSSDQYVKDYAIEAKARLVTSQDLWIKFREANCSLAGVTMLGGTGEGIMIAACYSKMTIDRLKEIMEIF